MRYRISQIKTDIDVPVSDIPRRVAARAGIKTEEIIKWEIRRKSIDSRRKPYIQLVYTVDFVTSKRLKPGRIKNLEAVDESSERILPPEPGTEVLGSRPVVIGMGPCGLFAGLELAKQGYRPIIIERGPAMEDRVQAVDLFKNKGVLDPEANMLFGEGGAGTFSDGKLATGIKDSLIRQVLTEFRDAGAGDDIMYLAKPHIGTDVLREVIINLRKKIEMLGGEVRFSTRLENLIIEDGRLTGIQICSDPCSENGSITTMQCSAMILAPGHSARDTFKMILNSGLDMKQKPFSIGVRMEHPQEMIDIAQYGRENAGKLPPADYRLAYKASNGRGVYSFCMCPGGEVVVCSTEEGELCVNGMSRRKRDSGTANSGILCDVRTEDFGSDDVLAGVYFQEKYERLAFINGGSDFTAPSCSMGDFIEGESAAARRVIGSLPGFAAEAIREAVPDFGRKIKGYDDAQAVVTAVETRSSSPVRILRGERGESNISGIYPAGEGAGYAGGITSAACDGIRAAWRVIERFERP